ncbi:cysteine-rich RLK (RECEPTOR-like protein kinase) 18 [Actinidia rufa]|uniref:Cysteine-rich RLK (RECEPTOR-like protein kinase) 18 n=1 Tax=Actinidia rufa TaxID=165716 RepID=A0A7J0F1J1_9ERIC|nr:cysteine-rich RLK (RECEPTOR-like protein kinase) 18 [Actinidia rufa]
MGVDPRGSPQIVIWDGLDRTLEKRALEWSNIYCSDLLRFQIAWDGNEEQLWWDEGRNEWSVLQLQPANESVSKGLYPRTRANGRAEIGQAVVLEGHSYNLMEAENSEDCEENCSKNYGGNDLYIRVANSELELSTSRWKNNQLPPIDERRNRDSSTDFSGPDDLSAERQQCNGSELSVFSFSEVAAATNNFSEKNKLGKGGFGSVYKPTFTSMRSFGGIDLVRESQDVASSNDVTVSLIIGR